MKTTFLLCMMLAFNIASFYSNSTNDSVYIRVHFLHGSKPKWKFRKQEDRWFGGMLGGHAGIEYEPNKIINFHLRGMFHVFPKPNLINSKFSVHDTIAFYELLGATGYPVKKTSITIKISKQQKLKLDSIAAAYQKRAPYDYAFFGMRCGSATYDILSQIGVVKKMSMRKTRRTIFYPRIIRRILESDAKHKNYTVQKSAGSDRRKWEKD